VVSKQVLSTLTAIVLSNICPFAVELLDSTFGVVVVKPTLHSPPLSLMIIFDVHEET